MKEIRVEPGFCRTCFSYAEDLSHVEESCKEVLGKFLDLEAVLCCGICSLSLKFFEKFISMCCKSDQIYQNLVDKESGPDGTPEFDISINEGLATAINWTSVILDEQLPAFEQFLLEQVPVKAEIFEEIDDFLDTEEYEMTHEPAKVVALKCEYEGCKQKFSSASVLSRHTKKTHEEGETIQDSYGCTVSGCSQLFHTESKLRRHLKKVHQSYTENQYYCDLCKKPFPSKTRLQYHMNMHLDYCPFTCDFDGCNKKFRNPSRLRNHKQEFHLQVIRMHCEICAKGFRTKAAYNIHILGHSDPTLPCEICGKLLTNKKTLAQHLKVHRGEKKFKCTYENCTKAFTKCSGLQVHMRCHTKEKPYECPDCHQKFTYNVVLKKHRQRDHNVSIEFMRKENPFSMPGKNSVVYFPKAENIKTDHA